MCAHVYSRICLHSLAAPFLRAVDVALNPNYNKVVSKPMSLKQVGFKLAKGYGDNADRFAADMRLIFANCKLYNSPTSEIWHWAHIMALTFEVLWREWVLPVANGSMNTVDTVSIMTQESISECTFSDDTECIDLCNRAAKQFQDIHNARKEKRLAAADENFSSYRHPACHGIALIRSDSLDNYDASEMSPIFFGYGEDDENVDATIEPLPQLSDAFMLRCLHHTSNDLQRTERIMRLLQQEDIEAWMWSDRIALLQLLCDAVARSAKLRERNDMEREANMELFASTQRETPWRGWSRTGAVSLGVDRHMNEFWAFGPESTQVFVRRNDESGWAVYDDASALVAYLMPSGLRESFLLAALQKRIDATKDLRSEPQFSIDEQRTVARQFKAGTLSMGDVKGVALVRDVLSEHALHVSGVSYTDAISTR